MSSDTPAHAAKWYVQNHPNGKYFSYEIPSVDQDQMASLLQDGTLPSTSKSKFKHSLITEIILKIITYRK